MIPWTAFGSTEYGPDWRIQLNEFNLYHYIERGPTQLIRGLDSSMLEQAHERQFAISQLGLVSAGFEIEHIRRIDLALQTLFHHFDHHPLDELQRPVSPHKDHLVDFDLSNFSDILGSLPPFDTEDPISQPPSRPSPAPPVSVGDRPVRSPLAIVDLINPDPISPKPAKRKYSDSQSSPAVDADSVDNMFDVDNEILYQSTLDYVRAIHPHPNKMTRTHREARMRRPSPSRPGFRGQPAQEPCETLQAEKEANLLLSFSKGYVRAAT